VARTLSIKVKPGAKTRALLEQPDVTWIAQVKAPPMDGKANADLLRLVAEHFGVPRAQVSITRGASGRIKRVSIA
jgi:uncharacterized protein (TIGR00251 family)